MYFAVCGLYASFDIMLILDSVFMHSTTQYIYCCLLLETFLPGSEMSRTSGLKSFNTFKRVVNICVYIGIFISLDYQIQFKMFFLTYLYIAQYYTLVVFPEYAFYWVLSLCCYFSICNSLTS